MPIVDTKLQAELVSKSLELSEKKRKLEEDIKIADARSKLLLESDALKDIEAYKTRFPPDGVTPIIWTVTGAKVRAPVWGIFCFQSLLLSKMAFINAL
jgi:hypothetical protein